MPRVHTAPGSIDFTVEVFVVCDAKVLLRRHDKLGIWLSVGGHVELHEDPVEAALREVHEEVGLVVEIDDSHMPYAERSVGYRELIPPVFMCRVDMGADHEHVTLSYFAGSTSQDVAPIGSDRSDGWLWCTGEDLDDEALGLSDSLRFCGRTALDRLGSVTNG